MFNNFYNLFDKIYCIHYLPYNERNNNIISEFSRVGLLSCPNFEWFYTTDNFLFDHIFQTLKTKDMIPVDTESHANNILEGYIKNERVFNLAINSYNLIYQAYLQNFNRILILEDDVQFLKSIVTLDEILYDFPEEYDIVSFDYWFRNKSDCNTAYSKNRQINKNYYKIMYERLVNASCISYSRFGMKHFLDGMNKKFMNSDYFVANQSTFDDWKVTRAVSRIPLCIQRQDYQMNHIQDMVWNYGQINLDLTLYY